MSCHFAVTVADTYTATVRADTPVGQGTARSSSAFAVAGLVPTGAVAAVTLNKPVGSNVVTVSWTSPGPVDWGTGTAHRWLVTASPSNRIDPGTCPATINDVPGTMSCTFTVTGADSFTATVQARTSAGLSAQSTTSNPLAVPDVAPSG